MLLFLAISPIFPTQPITKITKENDFFSAGVENKHFVAGFYNSSDNPKAEEIVSNLLSDFSQDPQFQASKFLFAKVAFKDLDRIVTHYEIQGNCGLFYYIENQLQQFREFGMLANEYLQGTLSKNEFYSRTHDFLTQRHDRIAKEVRTIEEFNAVLNEHKIIGVYLAGSSPEFGSSFEHLAHKHIDFDFFKIMNLELARQVFLQTTKGQYKGNELISIIRHKEVLTEFDSKEFVGIDASKSYERLRVFFNFERYPKLRTEADGANVFMSIFHKLEKLIMKTYTPDTPHEQMEAFEEAVQRLPKGLIYATVNTGSPAVGNFLQIFAMAKEKMQDNRMYFVDSEKHEFHIHELVCEDDAESIVQEVWNIYRKKSDLFKGPEREQFEGDDMDLKATDEL